MRIIKKILLSGSLFFFLLLPAGYFFNANQVFAQGDLLSSQEGMADVQAVFGEPEDIRVTIVKIINIILSVLGVLFVVLLVMAGFKYMTAAGNEDKVKEAVKQISQAVIGLIIILSAWGISFFILQRLAAAASGHNYLYF
ncbi:MAG: hypothetical protein RBT30_01090 [Patescibacteria group bacterium]|jgi:hypothetical protein|nr:hypothetical protein [Patescibacteria group bacterium]